MATSRLGRPVGHWTSAALIEETWRRHRPFHLLVTAILTALILAVQLLAADDLHRAEQAVQRQEAGGVTVSLIEPADDNQTLDAAACERLNQQPGIIQAGASFSQSTQINATWLPGGLQLPIWDLTSGALAIWWAEGRQASGLLVGSDLKETLGLPEHPLFRLPDGSQTTARSLPANIHHDSLRSALVRIMPPIGSATACWIRSDRAHRSAAEALAQTAFANVALKIIPYARTDALTANPVSHLHDSPTRSAWLVGLAAVILLAGLTGLITRQEVGIYRATGTAWRDLITMNLFQWLIALTCASGIAVSFGWLTMNLTNWMPASPDMVWYIMQPVVALVTASLLAGPSAQTLASLGAIVDRLR
ncbi:MAG: hypothetical protein LBG70_00430 [Bifidobacteriaceae bacterium]|jgi:hypothetical protein|nr:hypothetical protein [Bifidobacteriaceae bacterium]